MCNEHAHTRAHASRGGDNSKECDVFYAHPTTLLGFLTWNMLVPDKKPGSIAGMFGRGDLIHEHAGAFAESCNVWAPRYRQMGFLAQGQNLDANDPTVLANVKASMAMALADLKAAFKAFLAQRPDKTRPFVIAAHSQGSILMTKVIADCVEGTDAEQCFVAAYLAGGYVSRDLFGTVFQSVHECAGPTDLKCIISYDTRTAVFEPKSAQNLPFGLGLWPHHLMYHLHDEYCDYGTIEHKMDDCSKPRVQTNPLTWTHTDGVGEGQPGYLGGKAEGKSAPVLAPDGWGESVKVTDHVLLVDDPKQWWKGIEEGGPGNHHPIDIQFWYYNIQENVGRRIAAWRSQ